MLAIRFNRVGRRNKAQFRIVVQEHTVAPGGRHVEVVGSYEPHLKQTIFKEERIKYWLQKGAQASDSVHNLLVSKGIITGKKRPVKIKEKKKEEGEEAEKPAEKVEKKEEKGEKKEKPAAETKPEDKKEEAKGESDKDEKPAA